MRLYEGNIGSSSRMRDLSAMVVLISAVVPVPMTAVIPPTRPDDAAGQCAGKSKKQSNHYFKRSFHCILLMVLIACSQVNLPQRSWGRARATAVQGNLLEAGVPRPLGLIIAKGGGFIKFHLVSWSRHPTAPKCESPRKV
jgi:hypothetical protein